MRAAQRGRVIAAIKECPAVGVTLCCQTLAGVLKRFKGSFYFCIERLCAGDNDVKRVQSKV